MYTRSKVHFIIILSTGVANFNAKEGCLKCTTTGTYSNFSRTVVFPEIDCEKRTDEDFRNGAYGSHHRVATPFLRLPIDMIHAFPIGDSLHLLHLGVMKRLLIGWRDGTFRKPPKNRNSYDTINDDRRCRISEARFSNRDISAISSYLTDCKLPREFQRATRGLDCLHHWKGTEYKSFLHYVGIVALKEHLIPDAYAHFLLLFCAVTICSSKRYFDHLHVARLMIDDFIEGYITLYGSHYITSNVHNLCHLVDEVEMFGELNTFTAYPFENMLGKVKRLVRSGNRPLAQVAKRLLELNNIASKWVDSMSPANENCTQKRSVEVKKPFGSGNIPEHLIEAFLRNNNNDANGNETIRYYCEVEIDREFTLSVAREADSWFLTNTNKIGRLINVISVDKIEVSVCYSEYLTSGNFFTSPCESKLIDIHSVPRCGDSVTKIADVKCIRCKVVCLKYEKDDMYIFVPLSHTQNCI